MKPNQVWTYTSKHYNAQHGCHYYATIQLYLMWYNKPYSNLSLLTYSPYDSKHCLVCLSCFAMKLSAWATV